MRGVFVLRHSPRRMSTGSEGNNCLDTAIGSTACTRQVIAGCNRDRLNPFEFAYRQESQNSDMIAKTPTTYGRTRDRSIGNALDLTPALESLERQS